MTGAPKPWSLTGAARAARDARVAAIRYMRTSPVELAWHATILARAHESRAAGAGSPEAARALFLTPWATRRRTRPPGGRPAP